MGGSLVGPWVIGETMERSLVGSVGHELIWIFHNFRRSSDELYTVPKMTYLTEITD
jgi:hypothetical protein